MKNYKFSYIILLLFILALAGCNNSHKASEQPGSNGLHTPLFAYDTQVQKETGNFTNIENIVMGDTVLGCVDSTLKWETHTVESCAFSSGLQDMIRITYKIGADSEQQIIAGESTQFMYSDGTLVDAFRLNLDKKLRCANGSEAEIISVELVSYSSKVCTIDMGLGNNYFINVNGLVCMGSPQYDVPWL